MENNSYITELNEIVAANRSKVSKILSKHGFEDYPINALSLGVAWKQKPEIANDLASIIIPAEYSNVTDDNGKKTDKKALAGGILNFAANAVGMVGNVFGAKAAKDAVNSGNLPNTSSTSTNNNPNPGTKTTTPPKKTILGLTYAQAGIAAAVIALILTLLFFSQQKSKPAA